MPVGRWCSWQWLTCWGVGGIGTEVGGVGEGVNLEGALLLEEEVTSPRMQVPLEAGQDEEKNFAWNLRRNQLCPTSTLFYF